MDVLISNIFDDKPIKPNIKNKIIQFVTRISINNKDEILNMLHTRMYKNDRIKLKLILSEWLANQPTEQPKSNYTLLPSDILLYITDFLSCKSLYNLYCANKSLFILHNDFWKKKYMYYHTISRPLYPTYWGLFYISMISMHCVDCHTRTNRIDPFYNIVLCNNCKKNHKCLQLITFTTINKTYRLNKNDINDLQYIEVDNPHYKCASSMKLYLKTDIIKCAINKYKSLDVLNLKNQRLELLREQRKKK